MWTWPGLTKLSLSLFFFFFKWAAAVIAPRSVSSKAALNLVRLISQWAFLPQNTAGLSRKQSINTSKLYKTGNIFSKFTEKTFIFSQINLRSYFAFSAYLIRFNAYCFNAWLVQTWIIASLCSGSVLLALLVLVPYFSFEPFHIIPTLTVYPLEQFGRPLCGSIHHDSFKQDIKS